MRLVGMHQGRGKLLRRVLLAAGLVGGLSCTREIPEPVWIGQYITYGTTIDGAICGGAFHVQDRHVELLSNLIAVSLTEKISFVRVSPTELEEYCSDSDLRGCAYAFYAFSLLATHLHELNHVVAAAGGYEGTPAICEGFAQVFTDGGDSDKERLPIEDVLENFVYEDAYYYTAGLFVRFLIERHGLETVLSLMADTSRETPFEEFLGVYEAVTGEPLGTVMAEFNDYPTCSEMSNRMALVECNLPVSIWSNGRTVLSANVDCSEDDVLGPLSDGTLYTSRAFEIEKLGLYRLSAPELADWSGFRIVKCGSCWDAFDEVLPAGTSENYNLEVGRYYVLLGSGAPGEVALTIKDCQRLEDYGLSCD